MNSGSESVLCELLAGNERFRTGRSLHRTYSPERIAEIGAGQRPIAAVVACSDGRVCPEIVFDQPLASLFVSRVPGNVASDGTKWMLEIAVTDMKVPLVLVVGHTECLAIRQVIEGQRGAGGPLRNPVERAVTRARASGKPVFEEAVRLNAMQTVEALRSESAAIAAALASGQTTLAAAVYDVHTGRITVVGPEV
jgi:carbonic anhydrase